MLRSIRIATAVAAVCAVTVSASATAMAAAPPPRGTLTAFEYKQLTQELTAIKKFFHSKRATWNQGYAACHDVGQSTALLRSVRTNCDTVLGIDQSLVGFLSDLERCAALSTSTTTTGTTTTGTTTTGTSTGTTTTGASTGTTTTGTTTSTTPSTTNQFTPAELQLFACLQPEYAVISRAAKAMSVTQAGLRQQVLARHFVGRCLLTLAPTHADVELSVRFASTSKRLAADVDKLTKVSNGQAPASSINYQQLKNDSGAFSRSSAALSRVKRPQNLAVCPHEKS